ncbi:hypothetical protein FACS1894104_0580 [Actinomycetota bacterium]|nr:hypothetical protein FACS1894104_0580 [Actinomycetota bacterium]
MGKQSNWYGNEENATIEYEVLPEHEFNAEAVESDFSIAVEYDASLIKADKWDCSIAAASGILAGMLDVFWVGEFSLKRGRDVASHGVDNFVVKTAKLLGFKKDDLTGAVIFLEDKFRIPSDGNTPDFGGGKQHHLRDFAHHPTIAGLMFSLLTQFTYKSYGTDVNGAFIIVDVPEKSKAFIGTDVPTKIFFGTITWFFHLISDVAGSSGTAGKSGGTGIPGTLLALAKELSVLPVFENINVGDNPISVFLSKLFNGTLLAKHDESGKIIKDTELKFDLRGELGVGVEIGRQSIPNVINQCTVRTFYLFRRLGLEIKNSDIKSIEDLNKLNPQNFLPRNDSRCMARMLTISSGVFFVVDTGDAAIRAAVRNPRGGASFFKDFLFRINFAGIANFTFAIVNDAKYIKSDIKDLTSIKAEKILAETATGAMPSIEVEVTMDNSNLYEYTFESLYKTVEHDKKQFTESYEVAKFMIPQIIDVGDDNFNLYKSIVSSSRHATVYETKRLVTRMFAQNNIPFGSCDSKGEIAFTRDEEGKKIGYIFTLETTPRIDLEVLQKTGVNSILVISLINPKDYADTLKDIVGEAEKKHGGFVKYITLRDFFELFGEEEFAKYLGYAERYNERVKSLLGYDTIIMPSTQAVNQFKTGKSMELSKYSYQSIIPSDIYENQINILSHNYFERGLFRAMTGNSNFADSFVSAEWYYSIHKATGSLDQTAVVVGYLKSIEQLLHTIIHLSIDTGKTIKKKNTRGDYIPFTTEDENLVDTTLGSLIGFMKYHADIYEVNSFVKRHITATLDEYREMCRNGNLHKDNIYTDEEVENIRTQTIYLYFLLLGGCTIHDEEFEGLGMVTQVDSIEIDELPKLSDFADWLNPMLSFDPLINASVIYFDLHPYYNDRRYELRLATTTNYDDSGLKWTSDVHYPFVNDSFTWYSSCTKEEAQKQAVGLLKQYLESGQQAEKLKDHRFVVIGIFGQVECVYKNPD